MSREAPATRPHENLEEVAKPAATILRQEISSGTTQLERPTTGLFLSAVSAGLDLGFGPALMATVRAAADGHGLAVRVGLAAAYSIGFMIVILGRSELFTEHTTLAILPFLSRQTTLRKIGRLWALVYSGNLVGGAAFAALVGSVGLHLGAIEILLAVFYGHAGVGSWLRFMAVATLGNALGGTIFVALVKFGHVRFAGPEFSTNWR